MHDTYDSCPACQHGHGRRVMRLARPTRKPGLRVGPRPTGAALERHAAKYGPEQVAETAAEWGLAVAISRPKARRASRGPSLKTRVARLVAEGHGVDTIAEIENLSPTRARALVKEVQ